MQTEKPEVTAEQLKNTVRAYCFIEDRWFSDEESLPLRAEVGRAWSGLFTDSIKAVLGVKARVSYFGQFVSVYQLPFAAGITNYPAISQELAAKYGYVVVYGGDGAVGVQLYFVERSALSLNEALSRFDRISNLKS
ncbi:hypothetical protein [Pseudomonas simiae]|uniref:hypothetical protein n=1 Tax=Pseudomonas simiae TaxID=321846 RepID=UPI002735BB7E|nr:hypothetical protein [Pseudomonas simiae]WLG72174.1 hypothetical protein PSH60_18625 [Pseudomonas simiae]